MAISTTCQKENMKLDIKLNSQIWKFKQKFYILGSLLEGKKVLLLWLCKKTALFPSKPFRAQIRYSSSAHYYNFKIKVRGKS